MNRIIIIGNGFDLAHRLDTGYKDFINHYWSEFAAKAFSCKDTGPFKDERNILYKNEPVKHAYASFDGVMNGRDLSRPFKVPMSEFDSIGKNVKSYSELKQKIDKYNLRLKANCEEWNRRWEENNKPIILKLEFDNKFLGRITERALENWVDIEREYYEALKEILEEKNVVFAAKKIKAEKLNKEFHAIKELLEEYLIKVTENTDLEPKKSIQDAFKSLIHGGNHIAVKKQRVFKEIVPYYIQRMGILHRNLNHIPFSQMDEAQMNSFIEEEITQEGLPPLRSLILNFNYTNTAEKLYAPPACEIINIHGELNSKENPIIFGYGDELDDDYKKIEKLQDNEFLENIKSIKYLKTRNYRNLLSFIESDPYQVFVMGHSCGNSDRTLLNTLFEHENCVSIKVFYRQFEDMTDDHDNLMRNISRNFNDKSKMRDIVVNHDDCSPLVPTTKSKKCKDDSLDG